ncbi:MAG: hypothetical protein JW767_08680 [Thermoleophilia bacterium]|nr:hypothetical protein [Thermoleophilia bacterium]
MAPVRTARLKHLALILTTVLVAAPAVLLLGDAPPAHVARAAGEELSDEVLSITETVTPDGVVTTGPEQLEMDLGAIAPTWSATGDPSTWDDASDVIATGLRTVYVVGAAENELRLNLRLTKYGSSGEVVWSRLYDGPAHGWDVGTALAARGGAVYTAGTRDPIGDDEADVLLVRWDTAGNRVWVRSYDSGFHLRDEAVDVVVDGDGNVTVLGRSSRPTTGDDWVLVSYRPDGTRRWVRRYDGPSHLEDQPIALVADSAGRLYATGHSRSASNADDVLVLKYSQAGTRLWAKRYDGSGHGSDRASALHLRPGGGVHVVGRTGTVTNGQDALLLSYTGSGSRAFVVVESGWDPPDFQRFTDLEVLPDGRILCVGADQLFGGWDWFWAFYDADGVRQGRGARGTVYNESLVCVRRDRQGGIYYVGSWETATGTQCRVERSCAGGAQWMCGWPAAATTDQEVRSLAVSGVNVYVVGYEYESIPNQFVLGFVY